MSDQQRPETSQSSEPFAFTIPAPKPGNPVGIGKHRSIQPVVNFLQQTRFPNLRFEDYTLYRSPTFTFRNDDEFIAVELIYMENNVFGSEHYSALINFKGYFDTFKKTGIVVVVCPKDECSEEVRQNYLDSISQLGFDAELYYGYIDVITFIPA